MCVIAAGLSRATLQTSELGFVYSNGVLSAISISEWDWAIKLARDDVMPFDKGGVDEDGGGTTIEHSRGDC